MTENCESVPLFSSSTRWTAFRSTSARDSGCFGASASAGLPLSSLPPFKPAAVVFCSIATVRTGAAADGDAAVGDPLKTPRLGLRGITPLSVDSLKSLYSSRSFVLYSFPVAEKAQE